MRRQPENRRAWLYVLSLGVFASLLAGWHVARLNAAALDRETRSQASAAMQYVAEAFGRFEYGLRGARGAVVAGGGASAGRELFATYASSRDLEREFPGARGFGFIRRFEGDPGADVLEALRRDGWPDFAVRELAPNPGERFVILYIYPLDANSGATGLDIASETSRREAAIGAALDATAKLTAPITLVQAEGKPRQSFLMMLPVYRSGARLDTAESRMAATVGWTYAPLVGDEVLAGLRERFPAIDVRIFDRALDAPFHVSGMPVDELHEGALEATVESDVFGRAWRLVARPTDRLGEQTQVASPEIVLALGILVTLLLAVIARLGQSAGPVAPRAVGQRNVLAFARSALGLWSVSGLSLVCIAIAGLIWHQSKASVVADTESELERILADRIEAVSAVIRTHQSNLEFLGNFPAIRGFIQSQTEGVDSFDGSTPEQWRSRLRLGFTSYGEDHPEVREIRLVRLRAEPLVLMEWRPVQGAEALRQDVPLADDDRARLEDRRQRLLDGRTLLNPLVAGPSRDGRQHLLRFSLPVLDGDGLYGVIEFLVDISPALRDSSIEGDKAPVAQHVIDAAGRWIVGAGEPDPSMPRLWSSQFEPGRNPYGDSARSLSSWRGAGQDWVAEDQRLDLDGSVGPASLTFRALVATSSLDRLVASDWRQRIEPMLIFPVGLYLMLYLFWLGQQSRDAAQVQMLRLGFVLEQSRDAVIGLDDSDRVVLWSSGAVRLLGRSSDEVQGRPVRDLLPVLDEPLSSGGKDGGDVPVSLLIDGRMHWLEVVVGHRGTTGEGMGRAITIRDVTERHELQQQLMELNAELAHRVLEQTRTIDEERERLANILEGTGAGTWEWNVRTGEVRFNERWAGMLGYRLEDLQPLGLETWMGVSHPSDLEESRRLLEAHLAGELDYYSSENRMRHRDGHWVWMLARGRVITRSEDGSPEWMYGTNLDITEAKEARVATEKARKTLQSVLEAATEFSVIATDPQGLITVFNTGAERLLGYSAGEMVGKVSPAVIHLEEEVRRRSEELSAAGEGEVSGFRTFVHVPDLVGAEQREWTYVRKDGSHVPVLLTVTAIRDGGGEAIGYLGIAMDITVMKESERRISEAMQATKAASDAKGRFIANMSHEIRTPMNAVIGIAHLLDETPLDEEQRQLLSKLRVASRSLLGIINDILDLSKIESGEFVLEAIPFRPGDLLQELRAIFADQMRVKGLAFSVQQLGDVPSPLLGDAQRIRQILGNLVGNALKFTHEGAVRVELATVETDDGLQWLRWRVADTGIGIAPEAMSRLFQPFMQAEASTTRRFGGTGLGLSIVRQLATQMGGKIEASSEEGVGSEFVLWVPLVRKRDADGLSEGASGRLEVAIVGEEDEMLSGLAGLCSAFGWQASSFGSFDDLLVNVAASVAEGRSAPGVVLLSRTALPDADGGRALSHLHGISGARVPIVALEAGGDASGPARDIVGADEDLGLPADASALFNAVNAAVARHYAGSALVTGATALTQVKAKLLPDVRLLIVDDSEINLEVARRMLERHGAIVQCEMAASPALHRLASGGSFDAVLMDVQMPEMDGYAATRLIRQELGLVDLPVIALTAGALLDERRRAMESGMDDFLTKPLDPDALVRTLRLHVEKRRGAPLPVSNEREVQRASPAWPSIDGVDMAAARARLSGDAALFHRLLSRLLDSYGEPWGAELDERLGRNDFRWAAAELHRLRGSAGLLGASLLQSLAEEGERQCRESSPAIGPCRQSVDAVIRALQDLRREAAPFLEGMPATMPVARMDSGDFEMGFERYSALVESLRRQDMSAHESLLALGPWLIHEGYDKERFQAAVRLVEDLEYAAAVSDFLAWRDPRTRG